MDPNTSTLPPKDLYANQGPRSEVIITACFALAVVAVSLRLGARKAIKAPLWWDDFFIILALILAVGPLGLALYMAQHGVGKHAEVAGIASILSFYKCLFVFEILYPLPIAATKFSILFYYRRIFQVQSFKLPFYVVAALVGCWLVYTEVAAIFTCVPIYAMWDPFVIGRCINIHNFFIGIAVPNIITDIALLVMPLPYMWRLQVALPKKIAVMFLFILGGFVSVVSVIRLTVLLKLTINDVTWTYVPSGIWTNIEIHIGIVSASLPAFWPLLRATTTGKFRASNARSATDRMGSNPTLSCNQSRMFLGRRSAIDNEEGFLHLDDVTTIESSPSSPWDQRKDIVAVEQEIAPRVAVKLGQTVLTPDWRG